MTIKHLVISGGGPTGLLAYGAVSHLAKKDFWKLSDIKSIYGCSIGAYMGVVISLGYEWEWLDDYFIKRPWEKLAASAAMHLTDIYEKKAIINDLFLSGAILPLLRAKELSETITLKELYDYNSIDIHMYSTNINTSILTNVDISHTTHPDLLLITALQMTMAFPLVFKPVCADEACYVDGGLLNNYPLNDCLVQQKCNCDEILAFKNIYKNLHLTQNITEKSSIFEFFFTIIRKMQMTINTDTEQNEENIKYIMHCNIDELTRFDKWAEAISSKEMRKEVIENGANQADLFMQKCLNA